MGGKSRNRIFGDRVRGARVRAEFARKSFIVARRERDAAECQLWSEQIEGFGGPAQPSPTIAQCLNGGYPWLQVKCARCSSMASIPLEHVRRKPETPIWTLESAFRCRRCSRPGYRPPVYLVKLTQEREIPACWYHPSEL
ncbi:hypothetical protein V1291_004563 [Nitrobacteraceae bacterium AZCC 1564]